MSPMRKHCNEVEGSVLRAPIKPGISEKRSPEKANPASRQVIPTQGEA
jgi:hypothetical protein